ncbi:hypothetical protein O181_089364 [Austropuccinia psidii MF-1]|uniref:Uncharacterized protein n=1 Tax=Austropuccinia psidii MF-1 TaxID=1389203 RepID=A0A9Q3P5E5_9BASI|nr:hypothetical protein [Austropuccinia psidii MF-1]
MIPEAVYLGMGIRHRVSYAGHSHMPPEVLEPALQPKKIPDANLGGLVTASNAIGVNVLVDHGSWLVPPLLKPHIPWWNSSRPHSTRIFGQNQAHVWWHTTENSSPAHTKRSPQ